MKKNLTFCCALLGFGAIATAGTTSLDFDALVTAAGYTSDGVTLTQEILNSGDSFITIDGGSTLKLTTVTTIQVKGNYSSGYGEAFSVDLEAGSEFSVTVASTSNGNYSTFALYKTDDEGTVSYLAMSNETASSFIVGETSTGTIFDFDNKGKFEDGYTPLVLQSNEYGFQQTADKTSAVATWNVTEAGTYVFCADIKKNCNRATTISALTIVTEDASATPEPENAPGNIAGFTSLTLAVNNGITVTNAYLTYEGEVQLPDYEFDLNTASSTGYAGEGSTPEDASYNVTTHTFDFAGCVAWSGCGWGWWGTALDVTNYSGIVIVCKSESQVKAIVEGDYSFSDYDTQSADTDENITLTLSLDGCYGTINQLYFQNSVENQVIEVVSVTFVASETATTTGTATESLLGDGELVKIAEAIAALVEDGVDPESIAIVVEIDATAKDAQEGLDDVVLTGAYGEYSKMEITADAATYETAVVTFTYDAQGTQLEAILVGEGDTTPAAGPTYINGYLTVTVGGAEVGDANQEVTITVTEDADGKVTIELGSISASGVSLSDVAVVFTPESDGKFTNGQVSGSVIILGGFTAAATGTYEVVDGETTFTASFTYTLSSTSLDIAVSFTTVAPVVSDGWKVIATNDDFVTGADKWVGEGNNQITLTFEELEGYEYIKIVGTTKTTADDESYATWGDWGAIQLGQDWTVFGDKFAYDATTADQEPIIASIADIAEACGEGVTEFYIALWGNTIAVTVYASADYEPETESGTEEVTSEAGWTLTEHTKVGYESIGWDELEGYDAVKFVLYYDGDHTGWGMGGIYTFANGTEAVYAWTGTYDVDEFIITVADLKDLCDVTESGFAYNTWSPCVTIEVYFGVGEFTTGVYEGTSTAIASVASDVEAVEVARYNLMGQKISGAEKGINIIVYSDGSAKKVLVK